MRKSRRLSRGLATLIAIVTAATLFFTLGVFILFGVAWSCVPAHNVDGEGCARYVFPLTMILVTAGCLGIGFLAGNLVRRLTRHWGDDADVNSEFD